MLRSELYSIEQLKQHAVKLARQYKIRPHPGRDKLLPRLADNERVLRSAYDVVTAVSTQGQRLIPAETWLLDNYYLIEQQITQVRRLLPRGYNRQLPRLADGGAEGFPRIYDLALTLIAHMDGRLDNDNTSQFIAAFQTVEPLNLGELWAVPIMLQLALLENLRRIGQRIANNREERDSAVLWAERMLTAAETAPKRLIHLLADFADADVPLTASFVEEFYARLQAQETTMAFVQTWVEQKLLEQGVTAKQLSDMAGRKAAVNQISIANSIGSLRFIDAMDWKQYVESLSVVEQTLREDPAGLHAHQDFATRDRYRHVIEDVARASDCSELAVARAALKLTQAAFAQFGSQHRSAHIGYFLIDRGRPQLEQSVACRVPWRLRISRASHDFRLALYLGPILALATLMTAIGLGSVAGLAPGEWRYWFFALTGLLGAMVFIVPLINLAVTLMLPPRILPRLDFSQGIPELHRTLVVIPTLLSTAHELDTLLEALEIRYLGNRDPNLFFALLTDFRDAAQCTLPEDDALLTYARSAVSALNATYHLDRPGIFLLVHRPRVWNPHEGVWMGYERKRGKLEQFNALLRGGAASAFSEIIAQPGILGSMRYVITLDTDTQLPRDAARTLIGNMAHPLNRPVYDATQKRVTEGYAIMQPRVSISLTSASQSRFSKLFAGESGIDPYTREVSDVYQDLFGEGSFIGKGIYDVDAFRLAVEGRFPENLILSHDLLEGGYARSALVSDVELIEEHPASYLLEASRRHRWIRGDWQLVGWLRTRVPGADGSRQANPLSALSIWKIFDNLRRSLTSPALLALLVGGWLFGPGTVGFWTLLVSGIVLLPTLLSTLIELVRKPSDRNWLGHVNVSAQAASRALLNALLTLIFLPYDALLCLDAIYRSGLRMMMTQRGLLLWQLPAYSIRNARHTLPEFVGEMGLAPLVALALAAVLWSSQSSPWFHSAPILLLWLLSPLVAWWLSRPIAAPEPNLSSEQRTFLRHAARRTWRYFSQFVAAQDSWLPPDNFQEYPQPVIATRTSPTNMGMSLLANLSAYDFGYLSAAELLQRTELTLAAMERLERYRGHFYNWYDTRTLQALRPLYVSSVDSGNLLGSLLTLQAGLLELQQQPILATAAFQGLQDTLQLLAQQPAAAANVDLAQRLKQLQELLTVGAAAAPNSTLAEVLRGFDQLGVVTAEMLALLPDEDAPNDDLPNSEDLQRSELYYWAHAFAQQASHVREDLRYLTAETAHQLGQPGIPTLLALARAEQSITEPATERLKLINTLVARCRELATMDFEFLYDPMRNLLTIGYDINERRSDPAYYDLLASEARLASFVLIAQGQVPQKHWFALGRRLTSHGGALSLISWSGSMFEYLMPQLILPSFDHTLLAQTCKAAVARQIQYGRQRAVPWGISESCYNATDMHQTYQYRAFGVPGLGFKRGLGDDLVIAPYASALALMIMPLAACRNLQTLARNGLLGAYGFYESVDYTPSRLPRGKQQAPVRAYMAHHQGMSLLAFDYLLLNQPMQRRFMSDPLMRATELLLQERVPKRGATLHPHYDEVSAAASPPVADEGEIMRVFADPNASVPQVHLLSNGRYHVMATHAGGGYSRWHELAVTRWRQDVTCDNWGTFIYLRDPDSGKCWSSAYQPTLAKADAYEAIFVQAHAEYRRRDHGIETHTEITVSPEDDVEIRRVTLTNRSTRMRQIEVTSYAEVVLAPLNSDLAHRAFSNLFVQTEILPERQAILCTRRHRTPGEQAPWLCHLLAAPGAVADEPSYETDRAQFIGRGRTTAAPLALDPSQPTSRLSNTAGPVLDPIVAIRRTFSLSPDESVTLQIITGVAQTRTAALALLCKYCDKHFVERAFEMAWFHSQELLRHLNVTEADAQIFGRLANSVIYSHAKRRAAPSMIARNQHGQSWLWRFGVSGDLPIVLLRISDISRVNLVKQLLQAHAYWRLKGLASDLVIINEDFSGYRAVLQDQIIGLINAGADAQLLDKPGGVYVRRAEELTEEDRVLFQAAARMVLTDSAETLAEQVQGRVAEERMPLGLWPELRPAREPILALPRRAQLFGNGFGGFTPDGREYVVTLEPGQHPPAPWVNVIASPHIGTVVSDSGGAYTWVENAHEFRLTPWHNDPVSDPSGEALYIRDEASGAFWSPTPMPAAGRTGYVVRHGFGYSVFEHYEQRIASEMITYVAMDAAVKLVVIKLRNDSGRARKLSLTGYWELVLGEWRHTNLMHIVTEIDPHSGALFASNAYGAEFANRIVFLQVSEPTRTVTGNRTEFIGRNHSLANPAAMQRVSLSGRVGASLDPCAAMQTQLELADGQEREIVFLFGAAKDTHEAHRLVQRFSGPAGARQALEEVWAYWNHTLGTVHVETPDPALNLLTNGWLVYQTLSCRLWGRSGYYQSGGAYGFRDQLQDTMALVHATPWLAREQLLRCAERQFIEGDVQHWWHPPGGQGVRTQFSDDYLWLPYATCRYVQTTGDRGVLNETVHFLQGRQLNAGEEAYYDRPLRAQESASLYEHCVRAINRGLQFGVHGLPLMGCGDWNDGMNLVGREGKGESVWLAWFLYDNLQLFSTLAEQHDDPEFAKVCTAQAALLRHNIERNAWDGAWYRRAYFDDGTPLGSAQNEECQIDSISQSWAVLSGAGDPIRAQQALAAVDQRLVRREAQLIQLLDPPFDHSALEPGYIKGYVPGVRENGGQYTHAAIWAASAFALLGDKERAWELYAMINPINHGSDAQAIERYKVEPYVMCADIYGAAPHTGRGGWTWYTGAAGWMYRLTLETLLGLQLEADQLQIKPCVPDHWDAYKIHYRYHDTGYHITVKRVGDKATKVTRVLLDGVQLSETELPDGARTPAKVPLVDDRQQHYIEVELA